MKKILLSAIVASSVVMAAAPESKLVTHTELGFIDTQGNTRTQTFNLDASAKKNWGKHMFSLTVDAQYATTDDVENKNKYTVELNYDYSVTPKLAFGYLVGFKQDRFSSYDYQLYTGPAAKYTAIKSEGQNLNFEANILYAKDKFKVSKETNEYTAYRLAAFYDKQLLKDLKFFQELSYRADFSDSENFFAYSKTSLTSKISDILSAGLSYKVDYVNTPAPGKEYTDRTFTANLIIDY